MNDQAGLLRKAVELKRQEYIGFLARIGVNKINGRSLSELTYSELQEEFLNVRGEGA
ncbi:Fur-regulated basic protein FbpA [Bacillus tianshenii]|nr:Fur-regulated basic protein FbpA [Bacillus tianshenii]